MDKESIPQTISMLTPHNKLIFNKKDIACKQGFFSLYMKTLTA